MFGWNFKKLSWEGALQTQMGKAQVQEEE